MDTRITNQVLADLREAEDLKSLRNLAGLDDVTLAELARLLADERRWQQGFADPAESDYEQLLFEACSHVEKICATRGHGWPLDASVELLAWWHAHDPDFKEVEL